MEYKGRYEDIVNLPYHESKKRPRMAMIDRAAQFAPFAALDGHKEAIDDTRKRFDEQDDLEHLAIDE